MSIEAMRQARNAFVWNLNTDLDNISACDKWAKMLRSNIDNLDKAIAEAEQAHPVAWMHEMLRVQGCDGTWNCGPYMHGMYNGMEYMLAMVESREPVFRDAPDKWLNTLPPASLASEAHDIKENT